MSHKEESIVNMELFAYAEDMEYVVHKTHGRHSTLLNFEL